MEKSIITFQADEQNLVKTSGVDVYASDTVSYVEAHFSLGTNWDSFDSVRAMWRFGSDVIATVLDHDGVCLVPWEVLTKRGELKVNLVGSIVENDELTDRLTTFPIIALIISKIAQVTGDETAPITPSQFEQYVAIVKEDADRAEDAKMGAITAQALAETAQGLAEQAQASAETAQAKAETAQEKAELAQEKAETAREGVEEYALVSEGYAVGKQDGTEVGSGSPYYRNNSKYYSEQASDSATNASSSESNAYLYKTDAENAKTDAETAQGLAEDARDSASDYSLVSEGYAVGTQNGVAVESDSPYYHNNAKYFSDSFDLGLSVIDGAINITYEVTE